MVRFTEPRNTEIVRMWKKILSARNNRCGLAPVLKLAFFNIRKQNQRVSN